MALSLPRNTTSWALGRTNTFRAASSKVLGDWGSNLQNVPKNLRKIYKPDADKVFLQCDQRGADALIVAYLCPSGNYRDIFLSGLTPHLFLGMHLFKDKWEERLGKSISHLTSARIRDLPLLDDWHGLAKLIKSSDDWVAKERYYFMAKKTSHSSNYGKMAGTFIFDLLVESQSRIRLTLKEGERFLSTAHYLFPEIRSYFHYEIQEKLKKDRTLQNLFRFPRRFHQPFSDALFREAYAFIPQSTVACITHIAFTRLQAFIETEKLDWDIMNNCHDSYLVQCPREAGEILFCAGKMKEFMEQELENFRGERFKMASNVSMGENWGEMVEVRTLADIEKQLGETHEHI